MVYGCILAISGEAAGTGDSFDHRSSPNHPNWFDASYISWLSYDSLNIELPDGHLFFVPIFNWGKYREENGRLVMPVSVRLNHAIADGYLVANVFRLLEKEIKAVFALKLLCLKHSCYFLRGFLHSTLKPYFNPAIKRVRYICPCVCFYL